MPSGFGLPGRCTPPISAATRAACDRCASRRSCAHTQFTFGGGHCAHHLVMCAAAPKQTRTDRRGDFDHVAHQIIGPVAGNGHNNPVASARRAPHARVPPRNGPTGHDAAQQSPWHPGPTNPRQTRGANRPPVSPLALPSGPDQAPADTRTHQRAVKHTHHQPAHNPGGALMQLFWHCATAAGDPDLGRRHRRPDVGLLAGAARSSAGAGRAHPRSVRRRARGRHPRHRARGRGTDATRHRGARRPHADPHPLGRASRRPPDLRPVAAANAPAPRPYSRCAETSGRRWCCCSAARRSTSTSAIPSPNTTCSAGA